MDPKIVVDGIKISASRFQASLLDMSITRPSTFDRFDPFSYH